MVTYIFFRTVNGCDTLRYSRGQKKKGDELNHMKVL